MANFIIELSVITFELHFILENVSFVFKLLKKWYNIG